MLIPNKFSGYLAGRRIYPGGGKGATAAAPDPALVAAQIKSMGIQDDSIKQILANSQELMPLQKEQLGFGLKAAKTAYDQSQEDRTWAVGQRDKLTRLQNGMADEAATFGTEDKANELAGKAGADVTQAFSNVREQGARAQQRMGVNPNSGRAIATQNGVDIAQAAALASARTGARTQAKGLKLAMEDRAMGGLSGAPSVGMAATGSGAGFGLSGINATNSALSGMNSGFGLGGSQAGAMGSNATGMYGAQGNFNIANANLANQDPLMGAIGTIGGMAAGSYFGGLASRKEK